MARNMPEGGIPPNAPPDTALGDMEFTMESCDHEELPRDLIEETESLVDLAQRDAETPEIEDPELDYNVSLELSLLPDDGPPPWARYAETFNIDPDAPGLPVEYWSHEKERAVAANPTAQELSRAAKAFGITSTNFFSANPKLSKGGRLCYLSPGLMLAPYGVSGVKNLCPFASKGCATGCLNISGKGEMDVVQKARASRTKMFFSRRDSFGLMLERAMVSWEKLAAMDPRDWSQRVKDTLGWSPEDKCKRHRMCVRMNTLSDLPWEAIHIPWSRGNPSSVMDRYPKKQFYDYTKVPNRMMQFLGRGASKWPENYYLTFSWSEINAPFAFEVLDSGGNVALAFDIKPGITRSAFARDKDIPELPKVWCGYPVIDADVHDLRFLDNQEHAALRRKYGTGLICGLRMKGDTQYNAHIARKEEERRQGLPPTSLSGGFFQYADDAGIVGRKYDPSRNITNDPGYKEALIELAYRKGEEQAKDPMSWMGHGFRGLPIR